jgi:hypothetical protein
MVHFGLGGIVEWILDWILCWIMRVTRHQPAGPALTDWEQLGADDLVEDAVVRKIKDKMEKAASTGVDTRRVDGDGDGDGRVQEGCCFVDDCFVRFISEPFSFHLIPVNCAAAAAMKGLLSALVCAVVAATRVSAVSKITRDGKYLYDSSGTRFFIKVSSLSASSVSSSLLEAVAAV